jgi:hypothetical protein
MQVKHEAQREVASTWGSSSSSSNYSNSSNGAAEYLPLLQYSPIKAHAAVPATAAIAAAGKSAVYFERSLTEAYFLIMAKDIGLLQLPQMSYALLLELFAKHAQQHTLAALRRTRARGLFALKCRGSTLATPDQVRAYIYFHLYICRAQKVIVVHNIEQGLIVTVFYTVI